MEPERASDDIFTDSVSENISFDTNCAEIYRVEETEETEITLLINPRKNKDESSIGAVWIMKTIKIKIKKNILKLKI